MNDQQVKELVYQCRAEIDAELHKLHEQDRANAWTEYRAKEVAEEAAKIAVKTITDQFYMSVGKKTIATIGVMVIAAGIFLREHLLEIFTRGGK